MRLHVKTVDEVLTVFKIHGTQIPGVELHFSAQIVVQAFISLLANGMQMMKFLIGSWLRFAPKVNQASIRERYANELDPSAENRFFLLVPTKWIH